MCQEVVGGYRSSSARTEPARLRFTLNTDIAKGFDELVGRHLQERLTALIWVLDVKQYHLKIVTPLHLLEIRGPSSICPSLTGLVVAVIPTLV